ncbi:MAG: YicC family protein [Spirochaetaceae bacterium]|nr:MAG: YicC family protein [Spirochaetaceae bacterium]
MKSMTGFAFREHRDERHKITITIKSYNNRFLDILIYLPSFLNPLEQKIREFLSKRIHRGRIELYMKAVELAQAAEIAVDPLYVESYTQALRKLAEAAGIREKIRLSHLLRIEGMLKAEQSLDLDQYWQDLQPLLESVFQEFDQLRLMEGRTTHTDIQGLLVSIEGEIARIEAVAPRLEEKIKSDLRARFQELLPSGIDESRILAETAVLLMKSDIHEELVRSRSHLQSFRAILDKPGPMGKKLDFICQELNREFNTIGSKNLLVEVDGAIVTLKDSVEKIREQLRNVE